MGPPPIPTGFQGPAQPATPRPHAPGAWNRGHAPAPHMAQAPGYAPVSYQPAPAWPDAYAPSGSGFPGAPGPQGGGAAWPTGAGAPSPGAAPSPWGAQAGPQGTAWPTSTAAADPWGAAAGAGSAQAPTGGSRLAGEPRTGSPSGASNGATPTGASGAADADPMAQARARLALPMGNDPLQGVERRSLYEADRGAVAAQPPGGVERLGAPARELDTSGGGRLYLLEMYQQALDERDALEMEAAGLTSRLEQLQQRVASLEEERAKERERSREFERAVEELRAENQDLAARLVTAQIRRLEAEKMLIEVRIEQERGGPAAAVREAAPIEPSPEPTPTAPLGDPRR